MAFSLAKSGLFNSVNEVYNSAVGLVIDAYYYLKFTGQYQSAYIALNRDKK